MASNSTSQLTINEARVVAHICADGFLCKYRGRRSVKDLKNHPRRNIYRDIFEVGYCNTQLELLESFSKDIKIVYGLKTRMQKGNTVYIKAKWVFERVLSLGAGDSRNWFISEAINNANSNIVAAWLNAFFDDEAHVDIQRKRICVNSVNKEGLQDVQMLLKKVGVKKTKFYGPYFYKRFFSYRLTVFKDSIKIYAKRVGFCHSKKASDLRKIISNFS